jgi:hypothetical protein
VRLGNSHLASDDADMRFAQAERLVSRLRPAMIVVGDLNAHPRGHILGHAGERAARTYRPVTCELGGCSRRTIRAAGSNGQQASSPGAGYGLECDLRTGIRATQETWPQAWRYLVAEHLQPCFFKKLLILRVIQPARPSLLDQRHPELLECFHGLSRSSLDLVT